jgi:restriction system protein
MQAPISHPKLLSVPGWKQYQEDVASWFRDLGLDARTDVCMDGVRTRHNIDVLVKDHRVGFDVVWAVECKHWQTPVSKLHVLGLRQIVSEIGADRGILLCEAGFQSGAAEAATMTNVYLSSLAEVKRSTRQELSNVRFKNLFERFAIAREQYWEIPKSVRIASGLRQEFGAWYSGFLVLNFADEILTKSRLELYPITDVMMPGPSGPTIPTFASSDEVILVLDPMMRELEDRLRACLASKHRWNEL